MSMKKYNLQEIVVDYTPFLYEDGNTYYFMITERTDSTYYNYLHIFEKRFEPRPRFLRSTIMEEVMDMVVDNKTIDKRSDAQNLARVLHNNMRDVMSRRQEEKDRLQEIENKKSKYSFDGWNGIVGNMSEEVKKTIVRDAKLNKLFGKEEEE